MRVGWPRSILHVDSLGDLRRPRSKSFGWKECSPGSGRLLVFLFLERFWAGVILLVLFKKLYFLIFGWKISRMQWSVHGLFVCDSLWRSFGGISLAGLVCFFLEKDDSSLCFTSGRVTDIIGLWLAGGASFVVSAFRWARPNQVLAPCHAQQLSICLTKLGLFLDIFFGLDWFRLDFGWFW